MRVISEVSIEERYRQPLSEGLKGYFQYPGFDPKYIESAIRENANLLTGYGFNRYSAGGPWDSPERKS